MSRGAPAIGAERPPAAGPTRRHPPPPPSRLQAIEARTRLRSALFSLSRAAVAVEELPIRWATRARRGEGEAGQQGQHSLTAPPMPLPQVH